MIGYLVSFWSNSGFSQLHFIDNIVMMSVGMVAIWLAIVKKFEPLLLVSIGFGLVIGNLPYPEGLSISVYDENSVFSVFYLGVKSGILPPLIFMGIGALTDFSSLISSPKSILLGAAAQIGIFLTFIGAVYLGFDGKGAASVAIIGGADGPTSIFVASMLKPELIGPVAIAAYSYIALVPVIQPPFMKLLTTEKEKKIVMKRSRKVSKKEKILFPIIFAVVAALVAPGSIPLVGFLMLGNLLKESGVTDRLAKTAGGPILDTSTILLAFSIGLSSQGQHFLRIESLKIFMLGVFAFSIATCSGIIFAKILNLFLKDKINPLIGAAGVSAVPTSARVVHNFSLKYNKDNNLLMHAMAPNVAGVLGSAIAAGYFLSAFPH